MKRPAFLDSFTNVISPSRNELVFDGRQKDYGAYVIRRDYERFLIRGLIISISSFVLVVLTPQIIAWIKSAQEEVVVPVDLTPADMEPPPVDKTEPPPPPPPPPPVMETVKFTPPVVTDEPIKDKDIPPPQETETQVSTVTQEGDPNAIVIPEQTTVIEERSEEPVAFVEQMPAFPGGEGEMLKFIQKNIIYPQVEKEAGISGTVYLTFVVEKDGSITDVKALRGIAGAPAFEKEAIRVVKAMPKWAAGKQNGREVRVQFNLPVRFVLR